MQSHFSLEMSAGSNAAPAHHGADVQPESALDRWLSSGSTAAVSTHVRKPTAQVPEGIFLSTDPRADRWKGYLSSVVLSPLFLSCECGDSSDGSFPETAHLFYFPRADFGDIPLIVRCVGNGAKAEPPRV